MCDSSVYQPLPSLTHRCRDTSPGPRFGHNQQSTSRRLDHYHGGSSLANVTLRITGPRPASAWSMHGTAFRSSAILERERAHLSEPFVLSQDNQYINKDDRAYCESVREFARHNQTVHFRTIAGQHQVLASWPCIDALSLLHHCYTPSLIINSHAHPCCL